MTNHDRFKSAYKNVEMPDSLQKSLKEMERMENNTIMRRGMSFVPALLTLVVVILGSSTVCYAANVGGFRTTVNMWIRGISTSGELTEEVPGQFTITYTDANDEEQTIGGGGVAIDEDGNERPVTADEYMAQMNDYPDIEQLEDGTWMLYFKDQTVDITDKFVDGYCHIILEDSETGDKLYCSVRDTGAYSIDENKFQTQGPGGLWF